MIDNQPIYYKSRLVYKKVPDKKVPGTFFVPGTFLSLPLKRQCQAPYIGLICLAGARHYLLQYQLRFHKSFCGIKQNLCASRQILLESNRKLYQLRFHKSFCGIKQNLCASRQILLDTSFKI